MYCNAKRKTKEPCNKDVIVYKSRSIPIFMKQNLRFWLIFGSAGQFVVYRFHVLSVKFVLGF